ncbi:hypothetical protein [Polaromonas sp.]|uniref:hypothetical protein n=1 Tax=Polaromonas sp. TaxID=1869339 RepID=UPI003BB5277C
MARIEWVRQRLHNWALYKEHESRGGLGFATQSVLLSESSSGYRESIVPVDDVDAALTNQAVESLRPAREHLYLTLHCIYIRDMGIKGTARHTCKAESTVHSHLDQADIALSAWFGERAAAKKRSLTA